MAVGTISKRLHYVRAARPATDEVGLELIDLQDLVRKAKRAAPLVENTDVAFDDGVTLRIQHYRTGSGNGTVVHVARFVPGESASTVRTEARNEEDDEEHHPPPLGCAFKSGDSYLLLNGCNVVFCDHGISKSQTRQYLRKLFTEHSIGPEDLNFDLHHAANVDSMAVLEKQGAKSIRLKASMFEATRQSDARSEQHWFRGAIARAAAEVRAVLQDASESEQRAREDLIVELEIKLEGNTRASLDAQEVLSDMAEGVFEDSAEAEFAIITREGQTLTSNETRLGRTERIEKNGNSLSHLDAWAALRSFYEHLEEQNLLQQ